MTIINFFSILERAVPLMLFALYLLTAVRICRYSSWVAAGEPNPFLPRGLALAITRFDMRPRRLA
ncbi:MAG: hypothetical protein HKN98_00615 [Silicimonas sp.]|nr:hypothetical protein [Silicimonas sp.]NND17056.1 hypothetical protein [Silicimonas sp.]NNF90894.1 hypothetical protein [Boseongicola sp.]